MKDTSNGHGSVFDFIPTHFHKWRLFRDYLREIGCVNPNTCDEWSDAQIRKVVKYGTHRNDEIEIAALEFASLMRWKLYEIEQRKKKAREKIAPASSNYQ